MTQELIERTVRDWVMGNPIRGARELDRLGGIDAVSPGSPDEIVDALVQLAGRIEMDRTRLW